jgi:hypothetical protein
LGAALEFRRGRFKQFWVPSGIVPGDLSKTSSDMLEEALHFHVP